METSIGDKFYIPRLQLSKLLQKRVEMPKSENSKGEFKIDERLLKPEDIMVYTEFNPRSFEKFWKKWQPTGNLVFRADRAMARSSSSTASSRACWPIPMW